ncbi:MAG: hypothetical protein U5N55_09850 [Cypionkella sp.]|nr:hypothetical protein [Cypionkella sp.]
MNVTQAFNLFMRFVGYKLIHRAVNSGIDYAARRGKPEADMSEAERAQAASGRQFAQRARRIRSATRRFF